MEFENERTFGVIKIENKIIKLFHSPTSYSIINVGYEIRDAKFIGSRVVVNLDNGKIRIYKSANSYTTIE